MSDQPNTDPTDTNGGNNDINPVAQRPVWRGRWFMASAAMLLLLGLVGGGYTYLHWGNANTFDVHGIMSISGSSDSVSSTAAGGCSGIGGYADLTEGAQVVVAADGKTLGVGDLAAGAGGPSLCLFSFDVLKVKSGHKFYSVTVSHRGSVQYTEDQIRGGVTLSIGDGT